MQKRLAKSEIMWYYIERSEHPGVAQLGARLTGGQEAVSSSLATRTIFSKKSAFSRLFCYIQTKKSVRFVRQVPQTL